MSISLLPRKRWMLWQSIYSIYFAGGKYDSPPASEGVVTPEELERWIVPCAERLGAEPCDAMHFAADVRSKVESMMNETIEACAVEAEDHMGINGVQGAATTGLIVAALRQLKRAWHE
jgi:hypothetical protein